MDTSIETRLLVSVF